MPTNDRRTVVLIVGEIIDELHGLREGNEALQNSSKEPKDVVQHWNGLYEVMATMLMLVLVTYLLDVLMTIAHSEIMTCKIVSGRLLLHKSDYEDKDDENSGHCTTAHDHNRCLKYTIHEDFSQRCNK
jgi:uncharacterized protein YerC